MNFELWIRKKKRTIFFLPSLVFASAIRMRHWLYDRSILPQKKMTLPVISIGNLVAGGSGKTQVTRRLAQELSQEIRVAILSRGYHSMAEKRREPLLVEPMSHEPSLCGDEPWMLATWLPQAKVIVGSDRFKGAKLAEKSDAQVILLDDGMQHRRLARDVEIVVIDSSDPFGGGNFLPQGMLREDPKRLAGANMIIFVGEPTKELKTKVAQLSRAPAVEVKVVPKSESLKGKRVGVFCGIGNPERFVKTVQSLDAEIVATHFLSDHKKMGERALEKFALFAKQKGAEVLLCTEKDRVKLKENRYSLPIESIDVELEVVKNGEAWKEMIMKIKGKSL